MKWFLVILIPVIAFAAKGELVENLCYDSGLYDWDWPFFTGGGAYVYWVAFDYEPDDTYLVDQVKFDWVYVNHVSYRGDMNFEVYLGDFDDPPIVSFTTPEEDYSESDTGYDYCTYWDVYRGDIPLGNDAFAVSQSNEYWIALQMETAEPSDRVSAVCWGQIIGDVSWFHDTFGWSGDGSFYECSYALYGEVNAVKNASLGEIKALFR